MITNQFNHIKFLRNKEVLEQSGLSKSTLYSRINEKLFPPPISLGGRAVGWLSYEVNAVLASIVSGCEPEEVKLLVDHLISQRKSAGVAK